MSGSDPRESWDSYFIRQALVVSSRATCLSRKVGAVLVHNGAIKGTGYNGAPAGLVSCLEEGQCLDDGDGRCKRTVHAEKNVLLQSEPAEWDQGSIYCTDAPCWVCALAMANSPIKEFVFLRPYLRDEPQVIELFEATGKVLRQYQPQREQDLPAWSEDNRPLFEMLAGLTPIPQTREARSP